MTTQQKKKSSFALDVLTLVGGTTFAQIITLLAAPALSRLYAPEDFGVLAIFMSITGIIGAIACMRYEYSIMLPESDEDAINLFALSIAIVFLISLLTVPFIYLFSDEIIFLFNSPQLAEYLWLIPIYVFTIGIFSAQNYWNSRTKHFKRLSVARVSSSFTTIGTQVGAGMKGSASGVCLIIGNLFGSFVSTFVLGLQIWRDDSNLFKKHIKLKEMFKGLKRYKKFPLIDIWTALFGVTSWQLPAFLLAFFFSPAIVGFYSLGFRLLQMPMSLIGASIAQVLFQRASVAKKDNKLDTLIENVFRILVIIGLFPILTVTIVGDSIFYVAFGSEWLEAGVYAQILSLWAFVWFISSPLSVLYPVLEKQQNELIFHIINFSTRLASLVIGGIIGNARITLILFAISGILVYGNLCLKMFQYSNVKLSRVLKITTKSFTHFIPAGVLLVVLRVTTNNHYIIVVVATVCILAYYLYVLRKDKQLASLRSGFGL